MTISIGVASVGADQPDASLVDALTNADGALYHAKLAGRDTVRLADHWMTRPVGGGHDPFRHEWAPYSGVDGFSWAVVPFVRDG